MSWTTTLPTTPGFYWVRLDGTDHHLALVYIEDGEVSAELMPGDRYLDAKRVEAWAGAMSPKQVYIADELVTAVERAHDDGEHPYRFNECIADECEIARRYRADSP